MTAALRPLNLNVAIKKPLLKSCKTPIISSNFADNALFVCQKPLKGWLCRDNCIINSYEGHDIINQTLLLIDMKATPRLLNLNIVLC